MSVKRIQIHSKMLVCQSKFIPKCLYLNGPDIEEVDEVTVKTLILESVNVWKYYKKRIPSRSSVGVTRPIRSTQGEVMFTLNSQTGLEDVVFNYFIQDDFSPGDNGQVTSGSASLPVPVTLETEEQSIEREQNECDVH